jgi:hypothetical protein
MSRWFRYEDCAPVNLDVVGYINKKDDARHFFIEFGAYGDTFQWWFTDREDRESAYTALMGAIKCPVHDDRKVDNPIEKHD